MSGTFDETGTTGIGRALDPLGRVVIPAEIRRALAVETGDELEFSANLDERTITLQKRVPHDDPGAIAREAISKLERSDPYNLDADGKQQLKLLVTVAIRKLKQAASISGSGK